MASHSDKPWELYYWGGIPGRGEYIRLIFEETGAVCKEYNDNILEQVIQGSMGGYPAFAPPVLRKGNFKLSQTPVICEYLGQHFGLYPESEENVWHAKQVNATVHDFQAEGRLVFHAKHFTASYFTQQEETKGHIEWFRKERLERWLSHFENILTSNKENSGFVVGNKMTYVDLGLLQVLRNTANQFPEEWRKANIPHLKAFKKKMESRPNLSVYFKSDRCKDFEGNSMN